jgi:uncharacterized protein
VTALLSAILVSSLAGSLHCVAMCGPLVGLHGGGKSVRLALAHSLGRLSVYALLGVLAGAIGRAIDLAGDLGAVQRIATIAAGALIVVWGVRELLGRRRSAAPRGTAFTAGLVRIRTHRPALRATLAGALTGLLPCGWLWAFVVAAAGSGDPLSGALVMTTFWLGTVPAMLGVLTFAGPALAWLRARMPVVTGVALIVLGLGTLALRWSDAGAAQVAHPHCHRCAT